MQCATPSRRAQQAKTDLTRFDRVKNLNMGSFHIHRRGFFSSITAQVAAAVIPAERYEQQDKFWSSYRRHSLELSLP